MLAHQPRGGSHSSRLWIAPELEQPTRAVDAKRTCRLLGAPPLFGLAPGGVCHAGRVAEAPVRSYRTLSPLPDPRKRPSAVCSLWHFPCAGDRNPRHGGRYPPPLFRGARTFLVPFGSRLPGPLARCQIMRDGGFAKRKQPWTTYRGVIKNFPLPVFASLPTCCDCFSDLPCNLTQRRKVHTRSASLEHVR